MKKVVLSILGCLLLSISQVHADSGADSEASVAGSAFGIHTSLVGTSMVVEGLSIVAGESANIASTLLTTVVDTGVQVSVVAVEYTAQGVKLSFEIGKDVVSTAIEASGELLQAAGVSVANAVVISMELSVEAVRQIGPALKAGAELSVNAIQTTVETGSVVIGFALVIAGTTGQTVGYILTEVGQELAASSEEL